MDDGAIPTTGRRPGSAGDVGSHAVLRVAGMHCESCVELITEALDEEPGVTAVHVTRDPDEVRLTYDPGRIGVVEVAAVIAALGYTVTDLG